MQNSGLDESQAGIKIARRNINKLRYADAITLMAERKQELKNFLMSLAKDLSISFIFSKNQLLILLIFSIVFFVSVSFMSALIFMISFFLYYFFGFYLFLFP